MALGTQHHISGEQCTVKTIDGFTILIPNPMYNFEISMLS